METLTDNNLVKFKNVTRQKETMIANFKVKGIRRGVTITASIAVDIAAAELHPGEPLENIIEESARIGIRELQNAEFEFEGIESV
ncbi:MAG: hypothetical protein P0S94_05470 [Simkaniaceae bacterium]|nr:hypothetical protein [Simkaniaceae bacterium]